MAKKTKPTLEQTTRAWCIEAMHDGAALGRRDRHALAADAAALRRILPEFVGTARARVLAVVETLERAATPAVTE